MVEHKLNTEQKFAECGKISRYTQAVEELLRITKMLKV